MDQLPRLGKRELICLLSFTCNYVIFVWRGFLFLWVLGMGYVVLLWHSLSLPYNYFVRHRYYAQSPNYVWHVDGYDKLKPYSFCIHGAIDGYSRRILWLEVLNSNNSSGVIAKYYLDALANLGVCPRLLRCDSGTENAKLSVLQHFFRYNDMNLFLK